LNCHSCSFDKNLKLASVHLRVMKHRLVLLKITLEIIKDGQFLVKSDQCVSEMFVVDDKCTVVEVDSTLGS